MTNAAASATVPGPVSQSAAVAAAQTHIMARRNFFFDPVASAITPSAGPNTITTTCEAAKVALHSVFATALPDATTPVKYGP